jgi:hypothetical protein
MRRYSQTLFGGFLVLLCCGHAAAQEKWVPFDMVTTTTIQIVNSDGSATTNNVVTQRELHSSSGNVLTMTLGRSGTPTRGTLHSYTPKRGSFEIDYVNGTINERVRRVAHLHPRAADSPLTPGEQASLLGREEVNGVPCIVENVYSFSKVASQKQIIGKQWVAPSLNFAVLKQDVMTTAPNGKQFHVLMQTNSINAGTELDSSLFLPSKIGLTAAKHLSDR